MNILSAIRLRRWKVKRHKPCVESIVMPQDLVPTFENWAAPLIFWLAGDPTKAKQFWIAVAAPVGAFIVPLFPFGKDYHVVAHLEPSKSIYQNPP